MMAGELEMQIKVIPTPNSCDQGLQEFVDVLKKATWETHEQMGSSNPAQCSVRWEVDFQRELLIRLIQKLPPLLKQHGHDQVRIFNILATSCPRHLELFITSEKYRLKELKQVWGLHLQVLVVESTMLRMPENPVFGAWRPWQ